MIVSGNLTKKSSDPNKGRKITPFLRRRTVLRSGKGHTGEAGTKPVSFFSQNLSIHLAFFQKMGIISLELAMANTQESR